MSFAESVHLSELGFDTVSETDYGNGADEEDLDVESSEGFSLIGERIEPSVYDADDNDNDDIPSMFDEFLELPGPGLLIGKTLEQLELEALDLSKDPEVQSFCPKCCASYSPPPLTQNLPKLLPCLHTFCSECVIGMIKKGSKYKNKTATILECPTCHLKMTFKDTKAKIESHVNEMKNDPAVFNIFKAALVHRLGDLEDIEYNEYVCYRCSGSGSSGTGNIGKPLLPFYDDTDVNKIEKNAANKPRSKSAASVRDMVDSHEKEELNFNDIAHCVECDKIVCLKCAVFGKCRDHNMRYVIEAANDIRKELNTSLDLVMPTIDKLLATKFTVTNAIEETLSRSNILKAHVYNSIDELIHILRNREEELLEIVDRFTDRKVDELNKEKNKISEYIVKTMSSFKYAKSVNMFGSDTQVLDIRHMLFRRLSVVSNINYSLNTAAGSASYVSLKDTPLEFLKFLIDNTNIVEVGDASKTIYVTDSKEDVDKENDIGMDSLHIPKPVIFRPSSRPSFLLIIVLAIIFGFNSLQIMVTLFGINTLSYLQLLPSSLLTYYTTLPFVIYSLVILLIISVLHDMLCEQGKQWLTACYVNSDDFNRRAERFKEEMNKVNLFFIKSKTKATLKGDENVLLSERIGKVQSNRYSQLTENLAPYQEQNIVMEELYKKKHQQYMISLSLEEQERILKKSREVKEKKLKLQDLKKKKKKDAETLKKSKVELIKLKNKKAKDIEKKKEVSTVQNLVFDNKGFSNPNISTIPSRNSAATTAASLMRSSQSQVQSSLLTKKAPVSTYNKFSKDDDIEMKRKEHEAKILNLSPSKDDNHLIRDFDDDGKDIDEDIQTDQEEDYDDSKNSPTWKTSN